MFGPANTACGAFEGRNWKGALGSKSFASIAILNRAGTCLRPPPWVASNGYVLDRIGRAIQVNGMVPDYTPTQGQYLAFIYYYTKIHRVPPAEADMQRYFETLPPSIHQMILTLERKGFITRVPGQGRSIQLRLTREQIPDLV